MCSPKKPFPVIEFPKQAIGSTIDQRQAVSAIERDRRGSVAESLTTGQIQTNDVSLQIVPAREGSSDPDEIEKIA